MADLETVIEDIRQTFAAKDRARERALPLSREVIRYSATSIRASHRRQFHEARGFLEQARANLTQAKGLLADYPDVLWAGFVHDAEKEYAEGELTLAFVSSADLPSPQSLGVSPAAYINGLGEAAGELRRFSLDLLRQGEVAASEPFLNIMDDIYSFLVTMDFPDGVTAGLRRTTDMVRGVLERTRGDVTLAVRQESLDRRLRSLQEPASGSDRP